MQTQDFSEIQSRVRAEWTLDDMLEVPPRRAALSGLGGRCRGTYAAAWIVYVMYKRRGRKEEGGGGVGEGLILSVLSGIISPACVRTLCAEVIVALMATPIAAIASGPGLVLG